MGGHFTLYVMMQFLHRTLLLDVGMHGEFNFLAACTLTSLQIIYFILLWYSNWHCKGFVEVEKGEHNTSRTVHDD